MKVAVWNFYEEISRDNFLFKHKNASIGNNLCLPWVELAVQGTHAGIEFITLDLVEDLSSLDCVIFIDRPRPSPKVDAVLQHSSIMKYLVIYEGKMIKPDNWDPDYHQYFDRVFTWNDDLVGGPKYVKINYTVNPGVDNFDVQDRVDAFDQLGLATLIASPKAASFENELYSKRIDVINWFEAHSPSELGLYGHGWPDRLKTYKGSTENKHYSLQTARFSFCYENFCGQPGYITEKILDCMMAGVVPVYWGPPNTHRWIPADLYVDASQFDGVGPLVEHIRRIDRTEFEAHLRDIKNFTTSSAFYPFTNQAFVDQVLGRLREDASLIAAPVIKENAAAVFPRTRRQIVEFLNDSRVVICVSTGDEMEVFIRCEAVWRYYKSFFPGLNLYFVSCDDSLPMGAVQEVGDILRIGSAHLRSASAETEATGYAASGVWSPHENLRTIYRQVSVWQHLAKKFNAPFFLYTSTVTSIVDIAALPEVCQYFPHSEVYAGMPGRLVTPEQLADLTFTCGTNNYFSSDVMEAMSRQFRYDDMRCTLPNDIWQALTLLDRPRRSIPFFSFVRPRSPEDLAWIDQAMAYLIGNGHLHFRVKTSKHEAAGLSRADVDPVILSRIANALLTHPGTRMPVRHLLEHCASFFNEGKHGFQPIATSEQFTRGERRFVLDDQELGAVLT